MKKKIIVIIILILGFFIYCVVQNNVLSISNYDIISSKVTKEFKIVHLSDLHDKQFGKDNQTLVRVVKQQKPDIIVFTGDLVDQKTEDVTSSVNTLGELNKWAQVYYIPGNHEYRCEKAELIFRMLEEENVEVLNLKTQTVTVNGADIDIIGMDEMVNSVESINKKMTEFEKSNNFKIVLSHFPENFPIYYSNYDVDLVLSGHAHGGQFNIPFVGGLYAPGQGFFPDYYKGVYSENGVNLVVSRGLGNSVIPLRIFNNPEVVVINIKPSE